jgi:hypothetical protein
VSAIAAEPLAGGWSVAGREVDGVWLKVALILGDAGGGILGPLQAALAGVVGALSGLEMAGQDPVHRAGDGDLGVVGDTLRELGEVHVGKERGDITPGRRCTLLLIAPPRRVCDVFVTIKTCAKSVAAETERSMAALIRKNVLHGYTSTKAVHPKAGTYNVYAYLTPIGHRSITRSRASAAYYALAGAY